MVRRGCGALIRRASRTSLNALAGRDRVPSASGGLCKGTQPPAFEWLFARSTALTNAGTEVPVPADCQFESSEMDRMLPMIGKSELAEFWVTVRKGSSNVTSPKALLVL